MQNFIGSDRLQNPRYPDSGKSARAYRPDPTRSPLHGIGLNHHLQELFREWHESAIAGVPPDRMSLQVRRSKIALQQYRDERAAVHPRPSSTTLLNIGRCIDIDRQTPEAPSDHDATYSERARSSHARWASAVPRLVSWVA